MRFNALLFITFLGFFSLLRPAASVRIETEWLSTSQIGLDSYKDKRPNEDPVLIFRLFCSKELGYKTMLSFKNFFMRLTNMMPNKYLVVNVYDDPVKRNGVPRNLHFIYENASPTQPSRFDFVPTHMMAGGDFNVKGIEVALASFFAIRLGVLSSSQTKAFIMLILLPFSFSMLHPLYSTYTTLKNNAHEPFIKRFSLNVLVYTAFASTSDLIRKIVLYNAMKKRFDEMLPGANPLEFSSKMIFIDFVKQFPSKLLDGCQLAVLDEFVYRTFTRVIPWAIDL